jgi:hypothetical protein
MASLDSCILRAVNAGLMDPRRATEARALFRDKADQLKLKFGGDEALARAREQTVLEIRGAMAQIKRQKLLQVSRIRELDTVLSRTDAEVDRLALSVLSQDPGISGVASIETRHKTIRGLLHSNLGQQLERFRIGLLGESRQKAELLDVGRALFGQAVDNANAQEFAKGWAAAAERARRMFNAAGGSIPFRKDWHLPQSHNAVAVRAAGFEAWLADILPRLDLAKMGDGDAGISEGDFRRIAEGIWRDIATEGWAGREVSSVAGGRKLASRRMDHRFLVFKDFDTWHGYHERFGEGDIFSVMMGHLDAMARDISALQVLGPNPTATLRWMQSRVEKDLKLQAMRRRQKNDAFDSRINAAKRTMDLLWEFHNGSGNAPVHGKWARTMAGTRSLIQAAQLGGAALSALTDLGFQKMAAGQVGTSFRGIASRYVGLLNPLDKADQVTAVRLGLIADNWSTLASAQQRYVGEISGPEVTRRITDFVMRVSLLSPWTQAGRWAFGMEFYGMLADSAALAFRDLPDPVRRTLENHSISAGEWDIARASQMHEHGGARFLRAEDIPDEPTALKFLDMVHAETEFAVPNSSARGRAALTGGTRPGTIVGEVIRSVAMYKNFAATLMFTHFRRAMQQPTTGQKGAYIAQLILIATAMGALSLQAKQVAAGKDPRTMFDAKDPAATAKFWGAAAIQGGGLGIFGDFLFAQQNRYGGGLAETVAGPVVGLGAAVTGYVNENATKTLNGDDANWMGGAVELASQYTPGQSIWWAREGMEHLIWDQLRLLSDPKAAQRLRNMERNQKRDYGQESWWRRGDALPSRAPDVGAAFGG